MHWVLGGTVVHDMGLYARSGPIGRWVEIVESELTANITDAAPHGADSGRINKTAANASWPVGSLKANIVGSATRVGPRTFNTTVTSFAPYTTYVIHGTGRIYAKTARFRAGTEGGVGGQFAPGTRGMVLPPNLGYKKGLRVQSVSGQTANNFFAAGWDRTAARHSALKARAIG